MDSVFKHLFLIITLLIFIITSVQSSVNVITDDNVVIYDENGKSVVGEVEIQDEDNSVRNIDFENPKLARKFTWNIDENPDYSKGYFSGYYFVGNDNTFIFSHGKYQKPALNYYGSYKHNLDDKSALGFYLGYAIENMNHNEYFKHHHFKEYKIHHYFYKNNTMLSEQFVGSDELIFCAKNTSTFCPENTEAVCLLNTTVWCATKISFVKSCEQNELKHDTTNHYCVTTRIPCVKSDDFNCHQLIETVELPCIARIKILDVNEDKNGLTINNVAGTFVLGPVPPIDERTYCISIVAEPSI